VTKVVGVFAFSCAATRVGKELANIENRLSWEESGQSPHTQRLMAEELDAENLTLRLFSASASRSSWRYTVASLLCMGASGLVSFLALSWILATLECV
jgi:hypothetical protein